jgi:hypothetical protein
MEENGQLHALAELPTRKNRGTVEEGDWCVREPVWTVWLKKKDILTFAGSKSQILHPLFNRYTV